MESQTLEFRGINSSHLRQYFVELGGKPSTQNIYIGNGWSGAILSEGEVAFTSVFIVNTVQIRFNAETKQELEHLIKQYRYKTTRIGG